MSRTNIALRFGRIFEKLAATSICVHWSRFLAKGPVNYRTRTDLVDFNFGDPFVCGDRVTDFLQPDCEGAPSDGLSTLIISATNDVYFSLSFEQESK